MILVLWNTDDTVKNIDQTDADNFLKAVNTGNDEDIFSTWSAIITNQKNNVDSDFIADMEVALEKLYEQSLSAKA